MNNRACCCREEESCPVCKRQCLFYCDGTPAGPMDLDEAWDSGVYLPTPGANDPPTGYSDFDRTEHPCNDSKFEYALLICNVNEVKDDEFLVCLSGYELGPIKELGVNACGGRFFATSQEIVDVIKREPDEDCPQLAALKYVV